MSAGNWIVAVTKPQRERWAAENAARQGYEYYLPLTEVLVKKPNQKPELRTQCLFPRYLFIWTEGRWHSLLGTFGVTGVILQGGGPATMPPAAIAQIKAREGKDGIIRLASRPNEGRFKVGASVRVTEGAFSGYTGVYAGDGAADRVRVLLDFLGQKATVLIGSEYLEAVG